MITLAFARVLAAASPAKPAPRITTRGASFFNIAGAIVLFRFGTWRTAKCAARPAWCGPHANANLDNQRGYGCRVTGKLPNRERASPVPVTPRKHGVASVSRGHAKRTNV